jgi:hypothetical protein
MGASRSSSSEGESGSGKTRMLDELAADLPGVCVGRAICSMLEQHLPYVPLATAIRDAGIGMQELTPRLWAASFRSSPTAQSRPVMTNVDALEPGRCLGRTGALCPDDRRPAVRGPRDGQRAELPAAALSCRSGRGGGVSADRARRPPSIPRAP